MPGFFNILIDSVTLTGIQSFGTDIAGMKVL